MEPLYLPQLIDEKPDIARPNLPGWTRFPNLNLLQALVHDLRITRSRIDAGIIQSIPNFFARIWFFAQTLTEYDQETELHKQSLREWKGLMGLLCFRGHDIGIKRIEIPETPPTNFPQEQIDFIKLMNMQLPQNQAKWKIFNLFYLDNTLIGATSPLSLFFTPAEYDCPDIIPWTYVDMHTQKKRLDDPVTFFRRTNQTENLDGLHFWLETIKTQLNEDYRGIDLDQNIIILLDKWSNEIEVSREPKDFALRLPKIQLYPQSLFTQSLMIVGKPGISHVLLKTYRMDAETPWVICNETLKENKRIKPGIFGNEIKFPQEEFGNQLATKNGMRIDHPWINPEKYFFSDTLLKIKLNQDTTLNSKYLKSMMATQGLENSASTMFTLPLRKEFFNYFIPEDLDKQSFEIRQLENGIIRVSLNIPTLDGNFTIKKDYQEDKIIEMTAPPILELWPNFFTPNDEYPWKYYYFLYSMGDQIDCLDQYKFKPVVSQSSESKLLVDKERYIWRISEFPRIIECIDTETTEKEKTAGIILLGLPEKKESILGARWIVGFDFGTSNTSIFYRNAKSGSESTAPLCFEDRCLQISDYGPIARQRYLNLNFFPVKTQLEEGDVRERIKPDFPTMLRNLKSGNSNEEFLRDGISYFTGVLLEDPKFFESIVKNLKWTSEHRTKIPIYIYHLIMMICAEAKANSISNVHLCWSYPSSFGKEHKASFQGFWNGSCSSTLLPHQDIKITVDKGITESEAVCLYYVCDSRNKAFVGGKEPTLFIDIGGGSIDAAIWRKRELQLQTSLKLGANDVLAQFGKKNPNFFDELYSIINEQKRGVSRDFVMNAEANLNSLLRSDRSHRAIMQHLFSKMNDREPIFQAARWLSYAFVCGVLFYTGLLTRYLQSNCEELDIEKNSNGEKQAVRKSFNRVQLFWAGKGSRLVSWPMQIDVDIYKEDLVRIFRTGFGSNQIGIDIKNSDRPKEEVGRGLVYEETLINPINPIQISGETGFYIINGNNIEELSWNMEMMSIPHDICNFQMGSECRHIRRVIDFINSFADYMAYGDRIVPSIDADDFVEHAKQAFNDTQNAMIQNDSVQPVQSLYIIELKMLIDYMIDRSTELLHNLDK